MFDALQEIKESLSCCERKRAFGGSWRDSMSARALLRSSALCTALEYQNCGRCFEKTTGINKMYVGRGVDIKHNATTIFLIRSAWPAH